MSGPVRDSGLEYPQRDYGTDDIDIDIEATPATVGSYTSFQATTNVVVPFPTLVNQIVPLPHPYKVDLVKAIGAGLMATFIFTLFWYPLLLGFKNSSMDICLLLGSYVYPEANWMARLIGFFIHLGVGAGLGVSYASALMFLRTQGHAGKGAIFGAGLFFVMTIWVLPWVTPLAVFGASHTHFDMPSPFLEWMGPGDQGWEGFFLGMLAHCMFGMVLGAVYRHKRVDPLVGV